jgi:hypothetical protein
VGHGDLQGLDLDGGLRQVLGPSTVSFGNAVYTFEWTPFGAVHAPDPTTAH